MFNLLQITACIWGVTAATPTHFSCSYSFSISWHLATGISCWHPEEWNTCQIAFL